MEDRRGGRGNGPWQGWLVSLLIGAGLALLCMVWLGRRTAPPVVTLPVYDAQAGSAPQRSLGFEFVLRFRFLLPEGRGE